MQRHSFNFLRWAALPLMAVVLLSAGARHAVGQLQGFNYQYKVGVLPFIDDTGSGSDLSTPVARAVQTELTRDDSVIVRMITLHQALGLKTFASNRNGNTPFQNVTMDNLDGPTAVQIGRAMHQDVILLGTILTARSEASHSHNGGFSVFGHSVDVSRSSVKAKVRLQGDLYSVATGRLLQSIRVTANASRSGFSSDVSTSVGSLGTGSDLPRTPLGRALHKAVKELVQQVRAQQAHFVRYQPPAS